MTEPKRIGRPPRSTGGQRRTLVLTCTDEEWQRLLRALPQDTRERYELIAKFSGGKNGSRNPVQ
jgi:hypothetical protein